MFANRSISMLASGDGPHNRTNGASAVASAVTDAPLGQRTSDTSPLQIFVKAKKKINDIFVDIEAYVADACDYMHSLEETVAAITTVQRVSAYSDKVHGIRDVLTRDHMKVAFFGRTSNGKSTVINAMLRDKILPSGIGHTTNCFLQVEGSDSHEAYLITEQRPQDKQNVKTVSQLAHALCKEKLNESQMVRVFWPRDKCLLLRDDVVFVDSPGVDVTPNLDEWIDKHCLDADVFVLVANAESTLMVTEKNFFHKVSTKLSKPNIFILNNRWDASASEPEFLDQQMDEQREVRRQHQDRAIDFLVKELKVCDAKQAEERIFFISAKEALQARLAEQNGITSQPILAEGFQTRYFEFQDFERRFEQCISQSAVRTKFEQHGQRGRAIVGDVKDALDEVFLNAHSNREKLMERRTELKNNLERTEQQLMNVTVEMKDKIRRMVEDVEQRVSRALSEEIRRLAVLIDEFSVPFHPEPLVLNVYKRELHAHVELGLGSNLRARLSTALAMNIEQSQQEMIARMEKLLLPVTRSIQQQNEVLFNGSNGAGGPAGLVSASGTILPRRQPFEILYRLNCDNLCADFHEDLEFRFSWGITSLIHRFSSSRVCHRLAVKNGSSQALHTPLDGPPQSLSLAVGPSMQQGPPAGITPEDWSLMSKVVMASVSGNQGTVGGLFVAGFLLKTVGWRLIAISGAIYSCLYLYERLTWTNKAKERLFKRQYVSHATRKLRMIVDLTSANCSHQVQQELSGTFARLCHLVDEATAAMDREAAILDDRIHSLEDAASQAKVLKNKANYIAHELDLFEDAYLKQNQ